MAAPCIAPTISPEKLLDLHLWCFPGALGPIPVPREQSGRQITSASWHNTFFSGSWKRLGCQNGANMLTVGDLNCL